MAANPAAAADPLDLVRSPGRRRAVSIYGTIVTAAILAAAGDRLSVLDLIIAIVVTLFVYWTAEEYAEILGEQLADGQLPSWAHIRSALVATSPMISASFAPLIFIVAAWLLGATPPNAANAGLIAAIAQLLLYGWMAGRAARLKRRQQLKVASVTVFLGLIMITLKDVVLIYLH